MGKYRYNHIRRGSCEVYNHALGRYVPCGGSGRVRPRGFRRADGAPDWDTEDVSTQLFDMLEKDGDIQNDKPETNESNADGNYKETKGYDYNNQDIPSFDYADGDFQYMDADCGIMVNADGFLDDLSASGHILRGRKDGHPSKRQYADGFDENSNDVADTDKGDMYAFGTGGGFDADWDSADGLKKKEFLGGKFIAVNKIPFWEKDARSSFFKSSGLINKDVAFEVGKAVKKDAYKKGKKGKAMFSQLKDSSKWVMVSDLKQRAKKIKF
jgi:hypothetical protein